jgi:hypothetical protein
MKKPHLFIHQSNSMKGEKKNSSKQNNITEKDVPKI